MKYVLEHHKGDRLTKGTERSSICSRDYEIYEHHILLFDDETQIVEWVTGKEKRYI